MYLGISSTLFDQGRKDGLIPPPKLWGGRKLWDIRDLDMAFDELPREDALMEAPGSKPTGPKKLTWKDY